MLSEDKNYAAYIECFQNCREQGLLIRAGFYPATKYCIVTENRNSDNIRVYYGNCEKDLAFNNQPNEDKWDQCRFFSYNEHYEAAKFMKEFLFDA